jgi:hypothetical protein
LAFRQRRNPIGLSEALDAIPVHGSNSAADWEKARMLWLGEADRFSSHPTVLASAVQAFPVEDSMRLMQRPRSLEPSNAVWTVNLASIYARAVRTFSMRANRPHGRASPVGSKSQDVAHAASVGVTCPGSKVEESIGDVLRRRSRGRHQRAS